MACLVPQRPVRRGACPDSKPRAITARQLTRYLSLPQRHEHPPRGLQSIEQQHQMPEPESIQPPHHENDEAAGLRFAPWPLARGATPSRLSLRGPGARAPPHTRWMPYGVVGHTLPVAEGQRRGDSLHDSGASGGGTARFKGEIACRGARRGSRLAASRPDGTGG